MPESAEVKRTADWLERNLVGTIVRSVRAFNRFQKQPIARLDEIKNRKVEGLRVRGKVIVLDFEGDVSAVSTLGMTGRWTRDEENHVGLELWCERPPTRGMFAVRYVDQRRFGNFVVVDQREATSKLDALGWDPLAEPELPGRSRIEVMRYAHKKIADVLLKQDVFAGVGNYVRAEAMYRAKIHPDRLVVNTPEETWYRLCRAVADVVRESYELGGATLENFYDGDGKSGDYVRSLRVYGRSHDPDGNPVERKKDATGRTVWWVPAVQKEST